MITIVAPSFLGLLLVGIGLTGLRAADIQVEQVVGDVWYAPAKGMPERQLVAHSRVPPGYLRTESNGSFYASPGPESTFRLGEGSELLIESNEIQPQSDGGPKRTAVMRLSQGKITAGGSVDTIRYDIKVDGGRVEMAQGLSVVCIHGDGAHVYVARGAARIYPRLGIYRDGGLILLARPSIVVVRDRGDLDIQPLNSAAPGAFNCLLSGASPEIAAAIEPASHHLAELVITPPHFPPPIIRIPKPPVSPIQ